MSRGLRHPLWTHGVAVALYGWVLAALWRAAPLPSRIPMQFDWSGRPVRSGSPWELAAVMVLIPLLMIAASVIVDEMSARTERRKIFNWAALFDEAIVGVIAAMLMAHLELLRSGGEARFAIPWGTLLAFGLGAPALAAMLEALRPWHPSKEAVPVTDVSGIRTEVAARARAGERWIYWETQNPAYLSIFVCGVSVVLLVAAWQALQALPWVAPVLVIAAGATVVCYGGLRVSVTSDRVEVRLGMIGLRLLRLPLPELASSEVQTFSPLRDFGGWGIRYGRGGYGYFWRGNRGVQVRTKRGKQYLIGSDDPERLAAVIAAAREASAAAS
jgi:hypothetical protein